jgi:nicotinamide-nucleotide amidase
MKLHLLFIGNKFIYNKPLQEYIVRKVEEKTDFISSITYFKENDKSLFLYLEQELNASSKIVIVTTKQNFSTVGKLICTVTSDNQVLQDGMLIPQKSSLFEEGSYLLEYKNSITNVIHMDEMDRMPAVLFNGERLNAIIHLFEEDKETIAGVLNPIAQTYEVNIEIIKVVQGWFSVDVSSKKYGNIPKFIAAAKQLLPKNVITASNIIHHIIVALSTHSKKVTFAESCTGGLLSYYFTKQNGASNILDGSLITYSNELKENWLGIAHSIIQENGAVSFEVVKEMCEGAINVSHADYAISISGIAGDTGGTDEKPVGTVYIGVKSETEQKEAHLLFNGDRNYVQHQSALEAIKMLITIDKEVFF